MWCSPQRLHLCLFTSACAAGCCGGPVACVMASSLVVWPVESRSVVTRWSCVALRCVATSAPPATLKDARELARCTNCALARQIISSGLVVEVPHSTVPPFHRHPSTATLHPHSAPGVERWNPASPAASLAGPSMPPRAPQDESEPIGPAWPDGKRRSAYGAMCLRHGGTRATAGCGAGAPTQGASRLGHPGRRG
jgi:hypothetical protein